MAKFADDNEIVEQKEPMTYHAMFYTNIGDDEFINITIPITSPEIEDDEELRSFLEKKGKEMLATILSSEFLKKEWELEEFD
jgi:hypothetical protein